MKKGSSLAELRARFFSHLRSENRSERTIVHYNDSFKDLFKFLESKGLPLILSSVTTEHLQEYVMWLKETPTKLWRGKTQRSIHSVAGRLIDLSVFINWVERNDGMPHRLIVPKVKTVRGEFPVLSSDELQAILDCPHLSAGGLQTVRNKAIVLVLLDCGLRLGELVSIQPDGINWQSRYIKVVGKGSKAREIPFSNMSEPYLIEWARVRDRNNPRFFELKYGGMRQMLRRVKEESGVDFWTHRFRHTAASRMIDNGDDISRVQLVMGHKHIGTTLLYVHPDKAEVQSKQNKSSPLNGLTLPGTKPKRRVLTID